MDRREFVKKVAIGGVAVAVGGLVDPSTAMAAPKPVGKGYRVGDVAADFSGYDQYMRMSKLSDNLGYWTLIDLCPLWCTPCNESAMNQRGFSDYVNGKGIPFRMQPVVVEPLASGSPSSRIDAEKWAVAYGLEKFAVMHDNGDANSPLRQLVYSYANANNNSGDPGYPSYILVDPTGTIRQYLLGADALNTIQSYLAAQTGKTLDFNWFEFDTQGLVLYSDYGPTYATSAANFQLWDGTPVSDSGSFAPSSFTTAFASYTMTSKNPPPAINATLGPIGGSVTINLWDVLGESITLDSAGNPVEDRSKLFDLHSPITVTLAGPPFLFTRTYNRPPTTAGVDFEEKDPTYYPWSGGTSGTLGSAFGVPVTQNPDGSMTIGPFTPSDSFGNGTWLGTTDDERASNIATFNAGYRKITPYQAAIDLETTVNQDSTLSLTTRQAVASLLESGRSQLGNRAYSTAASKFAKAKATLQSASANPAELDLADWITAHITWLANH